MLKIDELKEYFSITKELPGEEDDLYKTIGGFVTYLFGRIPHETDACDWDEYHFEIVDMDNARIDKIMITRRPPEEVEDAADDERAAE